MRNDQRFFFQGEVAAAAVEAAGMQPLWPLSRPKADMEQQLTELIVPKDLFQPDPPLRLGEHRDTFHLRRDGELFCTSQAGGDRMCIDQRGQNWM